MSGAVMHRVDGGRPVLAPEALPYPAEGVFNAGVARVGDDFVMVFRCENGWNGVAFEQCWLGLARSSDGRRWHVEPHVRLDHRDLGIPGATRLYDPRFTVIEGTPHLTFALDTRHGVRAGVGVLDGDWRLSVVSLSLPDNRNAVLFPERVGGRYRRLERPMPVYTRGGDRFDVWATASYDLRSWGDAALVVAVEDLPFANDKIGPGTPPVRTEHGWLTFLHAVDRDDSRGRNGVEERWTKRYRAAVALLDLDDPTRVIGLCREPVLAPETVWETERGFRTNVVFPTGLAIEGGTALVWYGASDTFVCLANAAADDLVALCLAGGPLPFPRG